MLDAALRESREEIGLPAESVEIIGHLPSVVAGGQFHIAPVLGFVAPSVELMADAGEVARILTLPLDIMLNERHFRQETIEKMVNAAQFGSLQKRMSISGGQLRESLLNGIIV